METEAFGMVVVLRRPVGRGSYRYRANLLTGAGVNLRSVTWSTSLAAELRGLAQDLDGLPRTADTSGADPGVDLAPRIRAMFAMLDTALDETDGDVRLPRIDALRLLEALALLKLIGELGEAWSRTAPEAV